MNYTVAQNAPYYFRNNSVKTVYSDDSMRVRVGDQRNVSLNVIVSNPYI